MSDAMHMLALVHRTGDNYIANVTVETVTCPACGQAMRVEDIISGKHDYHTGAIGGIFSCVGAIVIIGGLVYLVASCT
ncbi:MAG TPA: hypothetical protein VGC46_07220 [Allosphingosinicella sp.]